MLSIIIPAKNEGKYLGLLLEDIQKQSTKQKIEVIIALAPSVDNTSQIAKQYGAKIVPGGLPGYGRNCGAKKAKGDMLLFLDADVRIPADFIAKSLAEFKRRHLDIASARIVSDTDELFDEFVYKIDNLTLDLSKYFGLVYIPGACILISKKYFNHLGGFDETLTFGEDADLGQRALDDGGKVGTIHSTHFVASARRFHYDGKQKTLRRIIRAGLDALNKKQIRTEGAYFNDETWHTDDRDNVQ